MIAGRGGVSETDLPLNQKGHCGTGIHPPPPLLIEGESVTLSVRAEGGYTNALKWGVLSGPGTVDQNGKVTAGALLAGVPLGELIIRVGSAEDSRVYKDLTFTVLKAQQPSRSR